MVSMTLMIPFVMWMSGALEALGSRLRDEEGQATAEYALVLIAAAAVAVALITWATTTGTLRLFFEAVVRRVRAYV
jgi:Flp pilus assembly pilin Flp